MRLDFYASQRQYLDHLAPVWDALDEDERGTFHVDGRIADHARRFGIEAIAARPTGEGNLAVASYADLRAARPRRSILLEHGVGQSYGDGHPSNPGGGDRDDCLLFLCPNERTAAANRAAYPEIPAEVVGCPKLDRAPSPGAARSVVLSFHWDNRQHPCARWALPHYQGLLPAIAGALDVVGHGHPRYERFFARLWRGLGVEHVADLDDALDRAALYVCDNSSSMWEAAARGVPVLALNAPWYDRGEDLPPRFWDAVPGLQCDEPGDLLRAIALALEDPPEARDMRAAAVAAVYAHTDGRAAERAARAIRETGGSDRDRGNPAARPGDRSARRARV